MVTTYPEEKIGIAKKEASVEGGGGGKRRGEREGGGKERKNEQKKIKGAAGPVVRIRQRGRDSLLVAAWEDG